MATIWEQAIIDARIERAQNDVRAEHNEMESRRLLGRRNYMAYDSAKFIAMVNMVREGANTPAEHGLQAHH